MATDYEQFYTKNKQGLGAPTKEYVTFFEHYDLERAQVLDVGCGQGRDALFIARLGHSVTAIDKSATGIRDLRADASAENLPIKAEVADIIDYVWTGQFDVVVVDRTLHMLSENDRTAVLHNLLEVTRQQSHLLISDERSNIPAYKAVLNKSRWEWRPTSDRRGFLFVQRG